MDRIDIAVIFVCAAALMLIWSINAGVGLLLGAGLVNLLMRRPTDGKSIMEKATRAKWDEVIKMPMPNGEADLEDAQRVAAQYLGKVAAIGFTLLPNEWAPERAVIHVRYKGDKRMISPDLKDDESDV